jgi:ribosomal protein S8
MAIYYWHSHLLVLDFNSDHNKKDTTMSILDFLNKKAQEVIEQELESDDTTITTVGEKVRYENAIILNEKLDFIRNYLKQLVESLNIIKPDNEITYNLIDHIQTRFHIQGVRKSNFSVHDGKSENGNRVILKYDLYSKKGLSVKTKNDVKLPSIRKHLSEKTIHYYEADAGNDHVIITLANPVSTRFIYAADLDNCMIVLNLNNFDGPWSSLMKYNPEDITEELMDETAKYIIGDESRFSELSGNAVSEKTILQLRAHLP